MYIIMYVCVYVCMYICMYICICLMTFTRISTRFNYGIPLPITATGTRLPSRRPQGKCTTFYTIIIIIIGPFDRKRVVRVKI